MECLLLWYSDVIFVPHKQLDRFIPNRSAMDFDYAHYMLTEGRKGKEIPPASSPSREAYRKHLAETFNMNRTRILAFKDKPPASVELFPPHFFSSAPQDKSAKPRRHIPQVGVYDHSSLVLILLWHKSLWTWLYLEDDSIFLVGKC